SFDSMSRSLSCTSGMSSSALGRLTRAWGALVLSRSERRPADAPLQHPCRPARSPGRALVRSWHRAPLALLPDRSARRGHAFSQLVKCDVERLRCHVFVKRLAHGAHHRGLEPRLRDPDAVRAHLAPAVAVPRTAPLRTTANRVIDAAALA